MAGASAFERFSVVIANYNQGAFVGVAIESALALDWHDVEVVVVDDGSTDGSREVIERYSDRVTTLYQENQTQRVARNHGYALTTGDVVVHLDADDVLHPDLAREAARVWYSGVSKVQVQMQRIAADGSPSGEVIPRLRRAPTPEQVRRWLTTTSAYPTPPGSGNVYARWFLDRLFPIGDECGPATDSYCLAVAPVLGDVVTILKPLASYRSHSTNTSDMLASPVKFEAAVARARARHEYRWKFTHAGRPVDLKVLFRSREVLQFRVANVVQTGRPSALPGDGIRRLLLDTLRSPLAPGPEPVHVRLTMAVWALLTLGSPAGLAQRLVRLRYGHHRGRRPGHRPEARSAWK